ncbi:hypothetical protein LUZ63_013794 [Rhynchospora breviuscula]|uniref:WRKY domain-containing protein n=1 Tax=Rhynchospora breviuscula TaxID=2022672 RepID=A0A9Q0HKX0_9POAL|nr:hypothetical protein LUZ63_013794 [Rhynchospora breviuscula]
MEACFLVKELNQMKDLVRQFEAYLEQPSSSIEPYKNLASKMHVSIEKSLNIAKDFGLIETKVSAPESPRSANGYPSSESFDQAYKNQDGKETISKKRKTMPKWRNQVTVHTDCGVVGPLEDGYSWRKYGQKDILGAKHPRGYYRCTHRNTQGCLATKQVQRTDENAMVFDVTYHGTHTCQQKNTKPNSNLQIAKKEPDQLGADQDSKLIKPFQPELKFKTEEALDSSLMQLPIPSLLSGFGETGLFSFSDVGEYGDFNEWAPMASSGTNSPVPDMDFMIEKLEFDPNFTMDASSFFA